MTLFALSFRIFPYGVLTAGLPSIFVWFVTPHLLLIKAKEFSFILSFFQKSMEIHTTSFFR